MSADEFLTKAISWMCSRAQVDVPTALPVVVHCAKHETEIAAMLRTAYNDGLEHAATIVEQRKHPIEAGVIRSKMVSS